VTVSASTVVPSNDGRLFDTVLVANRGEIAVRVMRTLRSMGIRSVAVYSDGDAHAPHVAAANLAVRIGPAAAAQSYLAIDRIISAALSSGATALHPGYGFLAENADLARACAANGIVFIGPPPVAIDAMGDKIRAKRTVAANGVRVVPGVDGADVDDDELARRAAALGTPLLIKPSAGGGGKGMRIVTDLTMLGDEIAAAKRAARGAFGDDTLLVERFIERPRHIEVQVLADGHGNVVHLGERECSLQRRHQKVIEEAPSPLLTAEQRADIGAQAVAAARACGYVNAGTVEFIVDGSRPDEPYFMEMNTRLQVEHPVTEMVWGVDLVELQVRIAAGSPLPFTQDELTPHGHAMEARVYAEDPAAGFLPTGGRVVALHEPTDLPHVRVDSGIALGTEVGSDYDPMLSKVIGWGATRADALRTLDGALAGTTLLGVTTNIGFLRTVLADTDVASGALDTGLVERIAARANTTPLPFAIAVAVALLEALPTEGAALDPWHDHTGWRLGASAQRRWGALTADGQPVSVSFRALDAHGSFEVEHDGAQLAARATVHDDELRMTLGDVSEIYRFVRHGRITWIGAGGSSWQIIDRPLLAPGATASGAASANITSPMPGSVVDVRVAVGDHVLRGQALVVVEAMKMEHTLRADHDGVVTSILVGRGDTVALHQLLVVVDTHVTKAEDR
jgi:acetyl-CoA/propionyl-CoA carboxylase biotin carboxyl carrier protein